MKLLFTTSCALALVTLGCAGMSALRAPPERAVIHVTHHYAGASPSEVEQLLTHAVEVAVMGEPGVLRVDAWSFEGASVVNVWHDPSETDSIALRGALYDRLGPLQHQLPEGAEGAWLRIGGLERRIVARLAISRGDRGHDCARDLATAAQRVPGVEEARVTGHPYQRLALRADPDRLKAYGLTISELKEALLPTVELPPGAVRVHEPPEIQNPHELMRRVVAQLDGTPVSLRDLATASLERDPTTERVLFDGAPGALLTVYHQPGVAVDELRAALDPALGGAANGCSQETAVVDLRPSGPVLGVEIVALPETPEEDIASMLRQLAAELEPKHAIIELGRPHHPALNTTDGDQARLLLRWRDEAPQGARERLAASIDAVPSLAVRSWEGVGAALPAIIVAGEDREALDRTVSALAHTLAQDGISADDGRGHPRPEVLVHVDRERLAALGLTHHRVAQAARLATSCLAVTQAATPSGFVPAALCLGEASEAHIDGIRQAVIQSPGGLVPLSAVADLEIAEEPRALYRMDLQPAARLSVTSLHTDEQVLFDAISATVAATPLPAGVAVWLDD